VSALYPSNHFSLANSISSVFHKSSAIAIGATINIQVLSGKSNTEASDVSCHTSLE